jgi:hypothetical protein
MFALYVLQRFDMVAAMLHDRFGFNGEFSIAAAENGPGIGGIRWELSETGVHRFIFDAKSYQYDKTRSDILAFYLAFPLYAAFSSSDHQEHGSIIISQMDVGQTPGSAWCRGRRSRNWNTRRARRVFGRHSPTEVLPGPARRGRSISSSQTSPNASSTCRTVPARPLFAASVRLARVRPGSESASFWL